MEGKRGRDRVGVVAALSSVSSSSLSCSLLASLSLLSLSSSPSLGMELEDYGVTSTSALWWTTLLVPFIFSYAVSTLSLSLPGSLSVTAPGEAAVTAHSASCSLADGLGCWV